MSTIIHTPDNRGGCGGRSSSSSSNNTNTKIPVLQAKVDRILARAGLSASPFDPLSMQALQDYLATQQQQDDDSDNGEEEISSSLEKVDIYSPPGKTARDDRLMDQLQLQTSLILDLQRKIENLSGRVKELENGGSTIISSTNETSGLRQRRRTASAAASAADAAPATEDIAAQARRNVPVVAPPRQHQQQAAPHVVPHAAPPPRESRLARLARVYGEMSRRQVPNFEWGLVFKVAIMMAILFSRLGGGKGDGEEGETPTKLYILGTVLVGGFLFQTGYAQFLYDFVVQENFLYRILVLNEDVVVPPPGPPRRPVRGRQQQQQGEGGGANNDEDAWFDWRETFLGGRIQRGEQAPQGPFLWRFAKEVSLLVFSFVLSIFPMWHPEPEPEPENDNEPEQQGGLPLPELGDHARQANNNGGPGVVRPPVDPAEAEEDEVRDE